MEKQKINLKESVQKVYNFKAKEEREILFLTKLLKDPWLDSEKILNTENIDNGNSDTQSTQSNSTLIRYKLVLLTKAPTSFHMELVLFTIASNYEIEFLYDLEINNFLIVNNIINKEKKIFECELKTRAARNVKLSFKNRIELFGFTWCFLKLAQIIDADKNIEIRGINLKDLEDYAEDKKFKELNPIFLTAKKRKKYGDDEYISERDIKILSSTLESLGVTNIINYDLEHLNTRFEQFSMEKSEEFLQNLQGDFKKNVTNFLDQLNFLNEKITKLTTNSESDKTQINELYSGIQKIEEKNHNIEIRNNNKERLMQFMKNLLNQLTITPQRKEVLLHTQYLATSELVIVNEVLGNFVEFYKNRRHQDIQIDLVAEGDKLIKNIITDMIKNFDKNIYMFIKEFQYKEGNLLRNIPNFVDKKMNHQIANENEKSLKNPRRNLNDYFLDRKFMVKKLNILFNNQQDLNEIDAFSLCTESFAKGLRDSFANEFNYIKNYWQYFINSPLLDEKKYNLYLDGDLFMKYDPFEYLNSEQVYEANKFLSTIIANTFFNCDLYVECLCNYFNELPMFNIERSSDNFAKYQKIIASKIYASLSQGFSTSMEKSILLGIIIFAILSSVQEKLNSSPSDFVQISLKDVFELRRSEDESISNNVSMSQANDEDVYDLEQIGVYKISLNVTKSFINDNIKALQKDIKTFMKEQKEIIAQYKCEIRRIGIIPIIKKAVNFMKLVLVLTNGIKSDSVFEIFEDFKIQVKTSIENIAATNKKYTNIVLTENFHYVLRFFKEFAEKGLNVDNQKFSEFENEFQNLYDTYKYHYLAEIFHYQFPDFTKYYDSFMTAYKTNKEQIKYQANFSAQTFEKNVNSFLKEIPKNIDKVAKRVLKHYCKEEALGPRIWKEEVCYWSNKLEKLARAMNDVYGKAVNYGQYSQMLKEYDFMAIYRSKVEDN